ncbi:hypothetical protein [Aquipuribacter nitratireducens]|uniref:Tetratricopeptide repeat protein n=1 Tax=Aquipuribacter nitratireducens TaxID=650104 RepID=A0ABW0GRW7_9MICO
MTGRERAPRRPVPWPKVVVVVLLVVLGFYLAGLLARAVAVAQDGSVVGWGLAAGLVALVLAGALAVAAELRFGAATQRLGRQLEAEDALPEVPVRRPGEPRDRAAEQAAFDRHRAEVQADPDAWRAWFRLALAYDAAGDRRRGRAAARHAVRLHRAAPGA